MLRSNMLRSSERMVYAKLMLSERDFSILEESQDDAEWAYAYAFLVIKGRWPEGEAAIATNPEYAYYYAKEIIEGKWPEGEAVIAKDAYWKEKYVKIK